MSWMQRLRSSNATWVLAPALSVALMIGTAAEACTSFVIRNTDGGVVYGRTMEMGFVLKAGAIVVPRKLALTSLGPGGKPGSMTWTSRYAAVGLNAFGLAVLIDGLNEKGLAGGALYFPDYVGYADAAKADPAKTLAQWDVVGWVLTSFATVAEVKAGLSGISVVGLADPNLGVAPLHYTFHDTTGASVVIEPVDGVLKVHDNPFGVMTNSPTFDWHLSNLRNYVKISPTNAPPLQIAGQTVAPIGQGSGLLGIPGDPTPPSRFIRALGYAMSLERKPAGIESVRAAEHILNNFDIPKGWVRPDKSDATVMEFTQWSTIADLANRRYYVKTYDDQVLRGIDLTGFDLDAEAIRSAPLLAAPTPPALPFPKP
ncbi:choloylglycine hydrolase [Rhodoplanes elegans]|uniref:Choloylglycine hydrolase n=2 Tax=Rhodoplanes elegans TaxID=29408 RepID=A0A327JML9_9BRAD|nr:choloylglycine hydrolase [Rhodoplanes elegans]RAI27659.1 choloylglycine hydrolase [Rhodoplanes elegans]